MSLLAFLPKFMSYYPKKHYICKVFTNCSFNGKEMSSKPDSSQSPISLATVHEALSILFPTLLPEESEKLAGSLSVKSYVKNDVIYSDADTPDRMYFLLSGKVKVAKNGVGGRSQIIRVIKPVEMFGYRAWFAKSRHRSTAMAFEASVVASVPMETIETLMRGNASVSMQIVRHLSVLLGQSDDRTVNLTQKHIRGRLAEALLFLKDKYDVEEDGCTLGILLNREDLATLSNMTTSNAIRTLSSFADEGIVAIAGKKIKILNEAELHRVSTIG